ncbi:MAG: PKD domain-containing protein [Acidimicrobiia bacterium]|nr:PKD domain-containing protein [Acidimicrobiia bacterium]
MALPLAIIVLAAGLVVARARLSEGETAGTISTYVGAQGCGAAPTLSHPVDPRAVVVDGAGNVYVGELNSVLRIDKATKAITTVPGSFDRVQELGMDGAGNLYVLEGPDTGTGTVGPPRGVKRVDTAGAVTQVWGPFGNNSTDAGPVAMAVANDGTIYLGVGSNVIRVPPGGSEQFVVTNATGVSGLAVDTAGNLYFADKPEGVVRKVAGGTGAATTVAGGANFHHGAYPVGAGDDFVTGETMAANGSDLLIVEGDRHQVVKLSGATLDLVAGNGLSSDGCFGDGGPGRQAELNLGHGSRSGVDVDPTTGDVYIADDGNNGLRRVAGGGVAAPNGRGTGWGTTPPTAPTTPTTVDTTPPTAAFDAPSPVHVGIPVQFIDQSNGATSWSWDFGDGTALDTAKDPWHIFTTAGNHNVTLTVTKASNGLTAQFMAPVRVDPPEAGLVGYESISPVRAVDTRVQVGAQSPRPVTGGTSIDVDVAGPLGKTPDQVAGGAVVLNVTGINPTNQTYLQVFPSGETRPGSSNVNLLPGQTLPNLVVAKVGANGMVSIFNAVGYVDVAADVMGFFPATSDFNAVTPQRVLETRPDGYGGVPAGRVGHGQSLMVDLEGSGAVPPEAGAVVLNVTAINPSAAGYVSVYPAENPLPGVSNLNFAVGETIANLVVVKLDENGQVKLFNAAGSVDLAADLMGWIPAGSPVLTGITPARVHDTRLAGGPLGPGQTLEIDVHGKGGLPVSSVDAVVVNVTAVDVTGLSYLTVFPGGAGSTVPGASNLNLVPGDVVPNLVIAKVNEGKINIFNAASSTNVIVDVMGFMG